MSLSFHRRAAAQPGDVVTVETAHRRLDRTASLTAHFVAFQRAAESLRPARRRLLDDRFSRLFAGRYRPLVTHPWLARVATVGIDAYFRGLHAHNVLRVRYTDDVLERAINAGIDQIVLLGAGFDSTSMRFGATGVLIYEVDAPMTQRAKLNLMTRRRIPADPRVQFVECDFEHEQPSIRLASAGFDASRKSLVIWVGVTMYLTRESFDCTLAELNRMCSPGSLLVLDYIDPQVCNGTHPLVGARRTAQAVRRRGEPYRIGFTLSDLTTALQANGFSVRDHARVPAMVQRYAQHGQPGCTTDEWLGIATAERIEST